MRARAAPRGARGRALSRGFDGGRRRRCRLGLSRVNSRRVTGWSRRGAPVFVALDPKSEPSYIQHVHITFDAEVETFERFKDEQTQHIQARRAHRRRGPRRRRAQRLCDRLRRSRGIRRRASPSRGGTTPHRARCPRSGRRSRPSSRPTTPASRSSRPATRTKSCSAPSSRTRWRPATRPTSSRCGRAARCATRSRTATSCRSTTRSPTRSRASARPSTRGRSTARPYGIPFTFGIEGFWYNTDLFEQAGHRRDRPTTLDELVDAVGKLARGGHHPDRRRRGRQVAGRALVVPVRAALLLARGAAGGRDRARLQRRLLGRGRRAARGRSSASSRSRRASSALPPRPARAARPASSPTARRPWSSWATGTPASIGGLTADAGGPGVPRLVPVPRHRGRSRRPDRRTRRRRRLRLLGRRSAGVRRTARVHHERRRAEALRRERLGHPDRARRAGSALEDPNLEAGRRRPRGLVVRAALARHRVRHRPSATR